MSARVLSILLPLLLAMTSGGHAFTLKDIRYRTENAGTVVFSHSSHLQQQKIHNNCQGCHQTANGKIPRVTMARMAFGASCGACHTGVKAFPLSNCVGCHKIRELRLTAGDFGPVTFSHRGHAQKLHCGHCHNQLYRTGKNRPVGMAAMKNGASCGACHDARTAFGLNRCAGCHPLNNRDYRIAGGGTVQFSHERHLGVYSCRDCHQRITAGGGRRTAATMADMVGGKSCGACHDGATAFTVRENCARCHTIT